MRKQDIIIFGEDWGVHPSSTQHLTKHLMQGRQIVWANSIGLRSPHLSAHDMGRILSKLFAMFARKQSNKDNDCCITQINPKIIPFFASNLARICNRFLLQNLVKKLQTELNNPIIWLSLPSAVDAIPDDDSTVIYYCGDDFGALDGVDHQAILQMEAELAQRADIIIVASERLQDKFPPEKTYVITHGVDFELFTQDNLPRPADLPQDKKIAGFYGSIASWLELEWLEHAAINLPNWQFVFIGEIKTDVSCLRKYGNIHFLGKKTHDELPDYISNWDISLIPFKDNEQIESCNPLKLREYLAAGKPIVASDFPAAQPYDELIYTAATKEDFVQNIILAGEESDSRKIQRREVIQAESWAAKAIEIEEILRHTAT